MILGFLLARAGIEVQVLEKHADFFRDFRGDTIHPSTLELMYELGILDDFLKRPHQELHEVAALIDDFPVKIGDFSHLPTHCKFTALMPQWDFLNFITEKAKAYPQFHLRMEAEVTGLIIENGRVAGVCAKSPEKEFEVRADLVVGADGRHSIVRKEAGLEVMDLGAPIDVLWMRLPREENDPVKTTLGRFRAGRFLVTLDRGDYWQCAYVISKGAFTAIQQKGLPVFREEIAAVAPFLRNRTQALQSWDDIKLLSVMVDRLRTWWKPGLLCIGDASHAMSPIGGVGINLAIQDAVAAANILWQPLLHSAETDRTKTGQATARQKKIDQQLKKVQARRSFPTRVTQGFQVLVHKRFMEPAMKNPVPIRRLPWPFKILQRLAFLRRLPAWFLGVGLRPEHIRTPDAKRTS